MGTRRPNLGRPVPRNRRPPHNHIPTLIRTHPASAAREAKGTAAIRPFSRGAPPPVLLSDPAVSWLRQLPGRSGAIAGRAALVILGCAVVAAGLLAYGNSLFGPFVFDDQVSILGNDSIRHLADALHPPALVQGLTVEGRPVLNLVLCP